MMKRVVAPNQGSSYSEISLPLCELLNQGQSNPFTTPLQAISLTSYACTEVRTGLMPQLEADTCVPLDTVPTFGTLYTFEDHC